VPDSILTIQNRKSPRTPSLGYGGSSSDQWRETLPPAVDHSKFVMQ
jgi:hypothetical protein